MSDVAAYHVFVCAFFPVQEGMWTGYSQSTYSSKLYVLPDDNMRCAIETCRNSESVLV
jgi:hypothetical protein